jgi:hypothetical protein
MCPLSPLIMHLSAHALLADGPALRGEGSKGFDQCLQAYTTQQRIALPAS